MEFAVSDNAGFESQSAGQAALEQRARLISTGTNDVDIEQIAAIADGNRDAMGRLYDKYASRLLGLLHRILRRRDDAEDVLQEAFVEIWRRAQDFDPARASVFGWMTLIARSRAIDRIRRRKRETPPLAEAAAGAACTCGCSVESADLADAARGALARLPSERRKAIELSFFDGLSHDEISQRENLPLGTVKTRIRLGMMQIRDDLRGIQASDVA